MLQTVTNPRLDRRNPVDVFKQENTIYADADFSYAQYLRRNHPMYFLWLRLQQAKG